MEIKKNIYRIDGFGPDIKLYESPLSFWGCKFCTKMTVVKLSNGDLFIHSPISISEEIY